ncbi:hypothetical protein [Desulfurobacterium sp.]|uniref:hypothetical protein n=1 Tax=Desulfurobacterium sp. TaxID=2004706 RepID=UPI0026043C52|nr:hypothetical protein [Desulfurobacterium sp.]
MSVLKEYSLSQEEIKQINIEDLYIFNELKEKGEKHIQYVINLIKENPWLIEELWTIQCPRYQRKLRSVTPLHSSVEETLRLICDYQRSKKISPVITYGFKNAFVLYYILLQLEGGRRSIFVERMVKKLPPKKIKILYSLYTLSFGKYETVDTTPPYFRKEIEDLPIYSNPYRESGAFIFEDKIRAKGFQKSIKGKIPFKENKNMSEEEKKELKKLFSIVGKGYLKYKALYKEEISGNRALAKSLYVPMILIFCIFFLAVIGGLCGKPFFYAGIAVVSTTLSASILYSLLKEKIYKIYPKPFITFRMWIVRSSPLVSLSSDYIKKEILKEYLNYNKSKEKFPELEKIPIKREIEKAYVKC